MSDANKLLSLEQAELFQQEAISTYEKCLARNLVLALQENEKLKEKWRLRYVNTGSAAYAYENSKPMPQPPLSEKELQHKHSDAVPNMGTIVPNPDKAAKQSFPLSAVPIEEISLEEMKERFPSKHSDAVKCVSCGKSISEEDKVVIAGIEWHHACAFPTKT